MMAVEIQHGEPFVRSLLAWVAAIKPGQPGGAIASALEDVRLEDLVLGLLDPDSDEASQMATLSDSETRFERCHKNFYETLQQAIGQLRLFKLFARTHDGQFHRSICPTAYDALTGERNAEGMARWRADFRAMSPERQMMAVTIIWLYRSGPDSIWLRRVPCTWRASEALHYCMMQDGSSCGCNSWRDIPAGDYGLKV